MNKFLHIALGLAIGIAGMYYYNYQEPELYCTETFQNDLMLCGWEGMDIVRWCTTAAKEG